MFTRRIDTCDKVTRSAIQGSIYVPKTKLKICEGNIRVRGPNYYNTITMEIREAKTEKSFKDKLNKANTFRKY